MNQTDVSKIVPEGLKEIYRLLEEIDRRLSALEKKEPDETLPYYSHHD